MLNVEDVEAESWQELVIIEYGSDYFYRFFIFELRRWGALPLKNNDQLPMDVYIRGPL